MQAQPNKLLATMKWWGLYYLDSPLHSCQKFVQLCLHLMTSQITSSLCPVATARPGSFPFHALDNCSIIACLFSC